MCASLLFGFMNAGALATAQYGYKVTDLGSWGTYPHGRATGLNNVGQVVGCLEGEPGESRAVVWLPTPDLGLAAGLNELGALASDTESCALDINNVGQIVGFSGDTATRPFLWEGGVMLELDTPPDVGDVAHACAVNDLGQVAGSMAFTWVDELLLWLPEAAYGLPAGLNNLTGELGPGQHFCNAADINNSGEIVGCTRTDVWPMCYAKIWLPAPAHGLAAGFNDVGTLNAALAINDAGRMAGENDPGPTQVSHAFAWQNGTETDLGTLGGEWSSATGIDSSGTVVGWAHDLGSAERAFLWDGNVMVDLNDLIAPATGWTLEAAIDINDVGQILVRGTMGREDRYGLLTPAVCGDGNTEGIEQCDDGNTAAGDGCDERCRLEPPIPTVTVWGAVVMTLLLLAAGTIFARARGTTMPTGAP
jgi:cysteine-rich repeat protein/probable HAF family extracellular repeat protein